MLLAALVWPACVPGPGRAQEPAPADTFLHQYAATNKFRLGRPASIQVAPDGDAVFFLRSGPRDFVQDLFVFEIASRTERVLLTAEDLLAGDAETLSVAERARRERRRMAARGISGYQLSRDGASILIPLSGRVFLFDRSTGTVREVESARGALDPRLSIDAGRVAFLRDGDLWAVSTRGGSARRLTRHEGDEVTWGDAEFVAQEEMDRHHGYWWSPDGTRIACQRTDVSLVEKLHIQDPAHPGKPPTRWAYPRPGRPNAEVRLFLVPVERGRTLEVEWDHERYPYLARVVWEPGSPLLLLVQNREQTEEVLLAVDERTGVVRELLTERDDVWLNLDETMPHVLENGRGTLWTSERDGEWRLELLTGAPPGSRPLTPLAFGYRSFVGEDQDGGTVWVRGSSDPKQAHLWRIPLDCPDCEPECLTREPGLHNAVVSRRHGIWVHTFEGPGGDLSYTVRGRNGEPLGELRSVAESPPFVPRVEFMTTGDSLRFQAAVIRPRDFDPDRRYPVLVEVYGGPSGQMVLASSNPYVLAQWFADKGFIVVRVDGRGTPQRGRAWERCLRGSFIDLPLEDQIAGLHGLGRRYPVLDLERVGIFGWSYGGYVAALAVMRRPDVFRAAIAGAPVTEWLDYDTHYTERYLGLPNTDPEPYTRSSVLASAALLQRPLLIVHGTDDDNVYFSHSLKLCDALQRAGRPFEFLPLVGYTHLVTDPLVTERLYERMAGFFVRELGAGNGRSGDAGARVRGAATQPGGVGEH